MAVRILLERPAGNGMEGVDHVEGIMVAVVQRLVGRLATGKETWFDLAIGDVFEMLVNWEADWPQKRKDLCTMLQHFRQFFASGRDTYTCTCKETNPGLYRFIHSFFLFSFILSFLLLSFSLGRTIPTSFSFLLFRPSFSCSIG